MLHARDAFNGLPLWTAKLQKGGEFEWEWVVKVACLIVAKGERVYALTDDGQFKALDAATGEPAVVYEMRAPHNWREFYQQRPDKKEKDRFALVVIAAKTGEEIQKVFGTGSSARHGEFRRGFWYRDQLLTEAHTREGLSLALFGLGDFSKPAAVFRANYAGDRGFGHCYPPVLTERFYINGQLHFTNLETRKQASNPIARGACNTAREGYIPANGMIYTFPNHCACFPALEGNLCLAPPSRDRPEENHELVRGPAWPAQPTEADTSKDWPTFRHDEHRTGGTEVTVPAQLEVLWTARIEGPAPEDPLVADGLAYAAAGIHPNADGGVRVACIRPETGEMIWQREFDDLGFESPWPAPYEPRKTRPDSNPWRTIRPIEYRYFDLPVRDGATLAEMKLGVPAWDGLAAAGGKLYLSTEGGNVVCLGRR